MNASGFVDAHVHIGDAAVLADIARAGVVAVRDAGSKSGTGLAIHHARDSEFLPAVVSAGRVLCKYGGYGTRFGTAVQNRAEIKGEILKLKAAGAGIIKVVASGMVSLKHPGEVTPGGFDGDELGFITEEAAHLGLGVMAHANGEAAIRSAAEAGVRSIEHGFFMTEAGLDCMRKNGVFWVPTVGALRRAATFPGSAGEVKEFVRSMIARHLAMVRQAYARGVLLAVGTDCVLPYPRYREAYAEELAYFRQAGIPPREVNRIASDSGAKLLAS